jgi:hypothetical protein
MPSCEGEHVVEEVACCAFCAKLPADERGKPETFPSKSVEKRVKVQRAAREQAAPDDSSATDVAEQKALKKLATGELW